jgi:glycosyltransferase involved in cell wall biosynthesis
MSISVVMSVHNERSYVADAVKSVLRQTMSDFEFIIIDDGSTDGTTELLERLAFTDRRIVLVKQRQRGQTASLNIGCKLAKHELIARIDGDDLMMENRLERQLAFMSANPQLSVAASWVYIIDTGGHVIARSQPKVDISRGIRERKPTLFLEIPHCSVVMRKTPFLAVGGFNEEITVLQDRDCWGRMVTEGYLISVQPEFLSKSRRRPGSMTTTIHSWKSVNQSADFIDANITKRLKGESELTFQEYLTSVKRMPLYRRLNKTRIDSGKMFYIKATVHYSTGRHWAFLANVIPALSLQPVTTIRKVFRKTLCI